MTLTLPSPLLPRKVFSHVIFFTKIICLNHHLPFLLVVRPFLAATILLKIAENRLLELQDMTS